MSDDRLDALKSKKADCEARLARYEKLTSEVTVELQRVEIELKEITEGREFEAYRRARAHVERDGEQQTFHTSEFFELVANYREKIELEAVSKGKRGRPKKGDDVPADFKEISVRPIAKQKTK